MSNAQKKIAIAVVLVLAVVAAVIFGLKASGIGGVKAPGWVSEQPYEMIDKDSLELISLPLGEWRKLGQEGGLHKNPKTGAYTMIPPSLCASCGAKIPIVSSPDLSQEESRRRRQTLKCPVCGKLAL